MLHFTEKNRVLNCLCFSHKAVPCLTLLNEQNADWQELHSIPLQRKEIVQTSLTDKLTLSENASQGKKGKSNLAKFTAAFKAI